jgi:hypothetical protein
LQQATQATQFRCPLCAGGHSIYIFGNAQLRVYRCAGCTLTYSQKSRSSIVALDPDPKGSSQDGSEHQGILAAVGSTEFSGPVLVFAQPNDAIARHLEARGVTIGRMASPDEFGIADLGGPYDGAIVTDALMQATDPRAALTKIRQSLRPGAPLLLGMPLLDSYQARLMGPNWHHWQVWNRWYFVRETLNLALLAAGFEKIWFETERRRHSLDSIVERTRVGGVNALLLRGIRALLRLSPRSLGKIRIRVPSARVIVTAAAAVPNPECVVSIIVPAFNEASTFKSLMDALLAKKLPGLRKEIIVVESNSTDGTRELARAYEDHPEVTIIWQPRPRGKGHAVREGLNAATGDIVLIQDADLEYDLDDYDDLLAPLLAWQTMFVLGSRHQGDWKIRKFNDAPLTAAIFNFAHWSLTWLINVAVGTELSDPFTMFKLFRRDALFGTNLVGNRFELDIELVVKLIRKGYIPLELPVNYTSRSHAEGKKITVRQDGIKMPWMILKFRFATLGRDISQSNQSAGSTH